MDRLRGLSLFSGIGGIDLALRSWVRTVAYCEIDRYCQGVLLSRMQSGDIDRAPIWDDVRTLTGTMLPKADIIFGGFPCQDISLASNGRGVDGKRSGLVFEATRLVSEIRPAFVFMENSPGIRSRGAERLVGELARLRYDVRWDLLSASDVGAIHARRRWWLLATDTDKIQGWLQQRGGIGTNWTEAGKSGCIGEARETPGPSEWLVKPNVARNGNGIPSRLAKCGALGNAVVPACAREAFQRLSGIDALKD